MTDTTERNRLVELLAGHEYMLGRGDEQYVCECRFWKRPAEETLQEVHRRHIADVLIANGWSRTVERPEVDAEVEWGVRYGDGEIYEGVASRDDAEAIIQSHRDDISGGYINAADYEPMTLHYRTAKPRTVGPWQEAQ